MPVKKRIALISNLNDEMTIPVVQLAFVLLGVAFAVSEFDFKERNNNARRRTIVTQHQHPKSNRQLRPGGLLEKGSHFKDFRTITHNKPTPSPSNQPTYPPLPGTDVNCGCPQDCTAEMLQQDANGQTCLARIESRKNDFGKSELEACTTIASSYPTQCGPQCHPSKCEGQAPALCNCDACTEEIWNTNVGSFSCGTRILLSMSSRTEEEACRVIAERYPAECGLCNPNTCPV